MEADLAQILTVDDSMSILRMLEVTLQDAGHQVVQAIDGTDGLAKAKEKDFQLVITDLHMPGMNGIVLISELRKLPSYQFTPILMLTTDSEPGMKAAGKLAGATGWLVKPFDPAKLLATIQKVGV
jgi:two-component system chemotaxis response regulator CheY